MQKITEIVTQRETSYQSGNTNISKYVSYSQYETINTIEAYVYSKHISGSEDALGREKPFFNIVTSARNIWYRATDIDRKNIKLKATKVTDIIPAFLGNIILQEWMNKARFGVFLNDWGLTLATYGSAVSKFIESEGELNASVVPWSTLITDDIDFENNVRIEKKFLTPSQLRLNPVYNQDVVEELIESTKQSRELQNGTQIDTLADYIEIYEVQGNLPLSMITEKEKDQLTFVNQIHVFSYNSSNKKDFYLYRGKLKKLQHHKADLIKEPTRAMGIGAVEHLFQAQWMVNHSAKLIKDQLELISKTIYQTADANFVGRNVLTDLETGDILTHAVNQPLTQVNNASNNLVSVQNFANEWRGLAKEITSTPDAISGNTMPSGTAYRQVAILNQEANSLFQLMIENKGLAIEDMMREYIIPFIKTKLNTTEEIVAVLDANGIKQLDTWYLSSEVTKIVNKRVVDEVLNGAVVTPEQQSEMVAEETAKLQSQLSALGNTRFIKPSELDDTTWKDIFKGFEWEVEVEVSGESSDKQAMLDSLTTILQTIATNPQILQNPTFKSIFSKILETAGAMSPLELSQTEQSMTPTPQTTPATP
jgi:hypothetical protein